MLEYKYYTSVNLDAYNEINHIFNEKLELASSAYVRKFGKM